jgi:hypothetical protein
MRQLVLQRVPPGDRWTLIGSEDDQIYTSLTEGLNAAYMDSGLTQFYLDAGKGEVHTEDGKEKPAPIKKYSLYGEEY